MDETKQDIYITSRIIKLINDNNIHAFYISKEWRQKSKEIIERDKGKCQNCKRKGKVTNARQVHHVKYLRKFPELALIDSNLESICDACHNEEHKKAKGIVTEERW